MCGADVPGEACPLCGTALRVAGPTSLTDTPTPSQTPDPSLNTEAPVVTSTPTLEPTAPSRNDGQSGRKWAIGGFIALIVVLVAFALFRSSAHSTAAAGPTQSQPATTQSVADLSTTSSEAATTASPTQTPKPVDPQVAARAALGAAVTSGEAALQTKSQWVVQLDSKWIGISDPTETAADGTHTFKATDILSEYQALQNQFGTSVVMVNSTYFGTQLSYASKPKNQPLWTVVYDPGNFSSIDDANSWCSTEFPALSGNSLANVCYPRQATPPHA